MKAMNSSLFRTTSGPLHKALLHRPPNSSLSTHASLPRRSYHPHSPPSSTINRSFSETPLHSSPATVSRQQSLSDIGGNGPHDGIATVTGGNGGDRARIGAYYEEMIKSNPTDALLLGNYGKFLHEVEKDVVRAEEYYGRAILANPGDGELLSLYGRLIWETQRDEGRAKSYFEHAIHSSPNDCSILGSYAHFMWEAEEEEELEEEEGDGENRIVTVVTAAIVN